MFGGMLRFSGLEKTPVINFLHPSEKPQKPASTGLTGFA
jgi:hypothetical protein